MKTVHKPLTRRKVLQFSILALEASSAVTTCAGTTLSSGTKTRTENQGLRETYLSTDEFALLREVVEVIIPATDTPGAAAVNVHGFLDHLMAEWALPDTRTQFRECLREIEKCAMTKFARCFIDINSDQKYEVISTIDSMAFKPDNKHHAEHSDPQNLHCFVRFKAMVFLGYYHSEVGSTRECHFELVPSHYDACLPLDGSARTMIGDWGEYVGYEQILST